MFSDREDGVPLAQYVGIGISFSAVSYSSVLFCKYGFIATSGSESLNMFELPNISKVRKYINDIKIENM